MKNKLKLILFYLLQWTWGIFQNILGFLIFFFQFLKNIDREIFIYKGAIVTMWDYRNSASLGMFIFLGFDDERVLVHEYGHCIQSIILGPFYLILIGIPSLIWCNHPRLRRLRRKGTYRYSSFYTEKWANHLGEKVTDEESIRY